MGLSGYDNTLAAKTDLEQTTDSGRAILSLGVNNLTCSRNEQVLFSGISFSVQAGQLLMIEGANGSGKTSLLKTLCGFIQPDEGEVLWRGDDIRGCMDEYLIEMNYIGHNNGIKHGLTCAENLKIASVLAATVEAEDPGTLLKQYGLGDYINTPAQMLSSGQRRRLALARLAVSRARIWILDEPFTSLDEKGKNFIKAQMLRHLGNGGIIVLTSHEPVHLDKAAPVTIRL